MYDACDDALAYVPKKLQAQVKSLRKLGVDPECLSDTAAGIEEALR
jgi:hypothetical protein